MLMAEISKMNDKLSDIREEQGRGSAQQIANAHRLDEIHAQAVLTNGRVGSLEKFRIKIIAYSTVISFIFVAMIKIIS